MGTGKRCDSFSDAKIERRVARPAASWAAQGNMGGEGSHLVCHPAASLLTHARVGCAGRNSVSKLDTEAWIGSKLKLFSIFFRRLVHVGPLRGSRGAAGSDWMERSGEKQADVR